MSSWVTIKNDLIAFAESHLQLNAVGFGDPLAIGTDNVINLRTTDRDRVIYPLLFVDAQSASMPIGATNLTVSVLVMDRVADLRGVDATISGSVAAGSGAIGAAMMVPFIDWNDLQDENAKLLQARTDRQTTRR